MQNKGHTTLTHGPPNFKYGYGYNKLSQCLVGMFVSAYRPVHTCFSCLFWKWSLPPLKLPPWPWPLAYGKGHGKKNKDLPKESTQRVWSQAIFCHIINNNYNIRKATLLLLPYGVLCWRQRNCNILTYIRRQEIQNTNHSMKIQKYVLCVKYSGCSFANDPT